MSTWFRRTSGLVAAGAIAGALTVRRAAGRWRAVTEQLTERLLAAATSPPGRMALEELEALPEPVRRYFRAVLREGQPRIQGPHVTQTGMFRSRETPLAEVDWRPLRATHVATTEPPGFVWDARIRMAPLASVWARDGYVGGRASMVGRVLGLIPVVEAHDNAPLREGALQRHLAQSVWYPTALLPSERLRWTPIDDAHAEAILGDGDTSVSLQFEFAPTGEIVVAYTPARRRARPDGSYVSVPWGGRYRRYEARDGMRIPSELEVYWVVEGREQPYYPGRNVGVEFEFGDGVAR